MEVRCPRRSRGCGGRRCGRSTNRRTVGRVAGGYRRRTTTGHRPGTHRRLRPRIPYRTTRMAAAEWRSSCGYDSRDCRPGEHRTAGRFRSRRRARHPTRPRRPAPHASAHRWRKTQRLLRCSRPRPVGRTHRSDRRRRRLRERLPRPTAPRPRCRAPRTTATGHHRRRISLLGLRRTVGRSRRIRSTRPLSNRFQPGRGTRRAADTTPDTPPQRLSGRLPRRDGNRCRASSSTI